MTLKVTVLEHISTWKHAPLGLPSSTPTQRHPYNRKTQHVNTDVPPYKRNKHVKVATLEAASDSPGANPNDASSWVIKVSSCKAKCSISTPESAFFGQQKAQT
jgi:hypothetical protein